MRMRPGATPSVFTVIEVEAARGVVASGMPWLMQTAGGPGPVLGLHAKLIYLLIS